MLCHGLENSSVLLHTIYHWDNSEKVGSRVGYENMKQNNSKRGSAIILIEMVCKGFAIDAKQRYLETAMPKKTTEAGQGAVRVWGLTLP
eukprot:6454735-Amphidinium_carterae.2